MSGTFSRPVISTPLAQRRKLVYFGSLIAVIGLIIAAVEALKAFREWNEAGKRWDADTRLAAKRAVGGLVMALLGVGAVLEDWIGSTIAEAELAAVHETAGKAEAEAQNATNRSATAEAESLALKQRFAPRIELLTPAVRAKLTADLKATQWPNVRLSTIQNTKEADQFGGAIAEVIKDAGQIVRHEIAGMAVRMPEGVQGVQVTHIGGPALPVAESIAGALQAAGIPDVQLRAVKTLGKVGEHVVHIELFVGVRE